MIRIVQHSLVFSIAISIGLYPLSDYTKYSLALVARGRAGVREGGAA